MTEKLAKLHETYDRSDQEIKREIGGYLHDRPGRWISKQDIVDWTDIDESGVNRHLDQLHEDGFLQRRFSDGDQLQVKWNGRGAGGVGYWFRKIVPIEVRKAGVEISPLLTVKSLGSAYFPTLLFSVLILEGTLTGLIVVVISHIPGNSLFGVTPREALIASGIANVGAAVFLLLIPLALLLERFLKYVWQKSVQLLTPGSS